MTIFNDDMEFELIGVSASFWTHSSDVGVGNVHLTLAYTCKSKLPKYKREKLAKVKVKYEESKRLEWTNSKIPTWKELCYSVELKNILSNYINLDIK